MKDEYEGAYANAAAWYESIKEMVAALTEAANTPDREAAENSIHESALSVEVRTGWRLAVGAEDDKPTEYRILLTTGGPALQLVGELNEHGEPETAELQMQDWGLPWQKWAPTPLDMEYDETLLTFARCFYFGE